MWLINETREIISLLLSQFVRRSQSLIRRCLLSVFLCVAFGPGVGFGAPQVLERQSLDFGVVALPDSSRESTLTLKGRGAAESSITGSLLIVRFGALGRYELSGLPLNKPIAVEVNSLGGMNYSGVTLELEGFTTDLRENGSGGGDLFIGGTLRTSGTATPYPDGIYRGSIEIELSYPIDQGPTLEKHRFSFNDVKVELRTSISGRQISPLDFGRVHAMSANGYSAGIRLDPRGGVVLNSDPPARLVYLGSAQPGRISITGAAPRQALQVSFVPPQIYLTHRGRGTASAQFWVGAFETWPSGLAFVSNDNGELVFDVGASLKTEAGNKAYDDGKYEGVVTVVIDY